MKGITFVLALAIASSAAAAKLDPTDSEDALQISRKVLCSTKDAEPVTYFWEGAMYSRRQGERDKRLFAVEGMNVRQCTSVEDDTRGKGFKMVSREIMLYKDPETGEVVRRWDNPWTGETVDVLQVANDPVNFSNYVIGRGGQPYTWSGDIDGEVWRDAFVVPLYYPNPLASEYQEEIGGKYHATEMFGFFGDTKSLLNSRTSTTRVHVAWSRLSDWLPWMKMSGREGVLYVNANGRKLGSWDELSDTMKTEIRDHYPDYVAPPPLDDERKNETSWMYYKRVNDGERVAPDHSQE
ncbi:MAG: DUF1838 family protein [Gammaproteobacteria bacterium]